MQDIADCKSKIAEYLKDSDLGITIEELDDCIIELISCWCRSGVEPMAIALTLKPLLLRIRIIKCLKNLGFANITEALIRAIEKRVENKQKLSEACEIEILKLQFSQEKSSNQKTRPIRKTC